MAGVYSLAGNDFAFNRRLQPYRIGKPWRLGMQFIRVAAQPHAVFGAESALAILGEDASGAGKQFSKKEVDVLGLDVASVAVVVGELLPLTIHNLLYQSPTTRVHDLDPETGVAPHFIIPTRADTHLVVALLGPREGDPPDRALYALHWKYDDVCLTIRLPPCCCDSVFWYAEWCVDVKGSHTERETQWYANLETSLGKGLERNPFFVTAGMLPSPLQDQSGEQCSTQAGLRSTNVEQKEQQQQGQQAVQTGKQSQISQGGKKTIQAIERQGVQPVSQDIIQSRDRGIQQQLWPRLDLQFKHRMDRLWQGRAQQTNNESGEQADQSRQQQHGFQLENQFYAPFEDQSDQIWQQGVQFGQYY